MREFLRIDLLATRQAVDRLELIGVTVRHAAAQSTIRFSPRKLFLDGFGGLSGLKPDDVDSTCANVYVHGRGCFPQNPESC